MSTDIDADAIQNGAIHLMQVLPGMGAHYTVAEVDAAIDNVLTHYELRLLRVLLERVEVLWNDMPEGWAHRGDGQDGYILGYKQAIRDAQALLKRSAPS